jgi:hypothetical protein
MSASIIPASSPTAKANDAFEWKRGAYFRVPRFFQRRDLIFSLDSASFIIFIPGMLFARFACGGAITHARALTFEPSSAYSLAYLFFRLSSFARFRLSLPVSDLFIRRQISPDRSSTDLRRVDRRE